MQDIFARARTQPQRARDDRLSFIQILKIHCKILISTHKVLNKFLQCVQSNCIVYAIYLCSRDALGIKGILYTSNIRSLVYVVIFYIVRAFIKYNKIKTKIFLKAYLKIRPRDLFVLTL